MSMAKDALWITFSLKGSGEVRNTRMSISILIRMAERVLKVLNNTLLYYNKERRHQSLGYEVPAAIYNHTKKAAA